MIYSINDLAVAVEAYKSIASIVINENEQYYACGIQSEISADMVKNEFENYVIALMNSRKI